MGCIRRDYLRETWRISITNVNAGRNREYGSEDPRVRKKAVAQLWMRCMGAEREHGDYGFGARSNGKCKRIKDLLNVLAVCCFSGSPHAILLFFGLAVRVWLVEHRPSKAANHDSPGYLDNR